MPVPKNIEDDYFCLIDIPYELDEINNLIRNIAKEILREYTRRTGIEFLINERVCGIMLNFLLLNPEHEIDLSKKFTREPVAKFIKFCVDGIMEHDDPLVKCFKIQGYFMGRAISPKNIVEYHRHKLMSMTYSLTREITETEAVSKDDIGILFQKIVVDIALNASLGNPAIPDVRRETASALKSVMSKEDLINFIAMKKQDRYDSLIALREIVCGIRIFNKDAGHCSEGIIDIENLAHTKAISTNSHLQTLLNQVKDDAHKLTVIFTKTMQPNFLDSNITFPAQDFQDQDVHFLIRLLILLRQMEKIYLSLIYSYQQIKIVLDKDLLEFRNCLNKIHSSVKFRTAVPTDKIFPQFATLSKHWNTLQGHIYVISRIQIVSEQITSHASLDEYDYLVKIRQIIRTTGIDESDFDDPEMLFTFPPLKGFVLEQEMQHFCSWCIMQNFLLIPADPQFTLMYGDYAIGFRYKEAQAKFLLDPDHYMLEFIKKINQEISAIFFLGAYTIAKEKRPILAEKKEVTHVVEKQNECVQTMVHPVPCYHDKDYTWNIWDLRYKAIKLANLRKSKTTSGQTDMSYNRMEVKLQTKEMREKECQTKRDAYTNVPKPSMFVRHIRGVEPHTMATQTDLTRHIDQHVVSNCIDYTKPLKGYFNRPYMVVPHVDFIPKEKNEPKAKPRVLEKPPCCRKS